MNTRISVYSAKLFASTQQALITQDLDYFKNLANDSNVVFDVSSDLGEHILTSAIHLNAMEIFFWLAENKINIEKIPHDQFHPIFSAIKNDRLEALEFFLKKNSKLATLETEIVLFKKYEYDVNIAFFSVCHKNFNALKIIHQYSPDTFIKTIFFPAKKGNEEKHYDIFYFAVWTDQLDILIWLDSLKLTFPGNIPHIQFETDYLYLAVKLGILNIVDYLLSTTKPDLNRINHAYGGYLDADHDNIEIFKLIIQNQGLEAIDSIFSTAISHNKINVLKWWVEEKNFNKDYTDLSELLTTIKRKEISVEAFLICLPSMLTATFEEKNLDENFDHLKAYLTTFFQDNMGQKDAAAEIFETVILSNPNISLSTMVSFWSCLFTVNERRGFLFLLEHFNDINNPEWTFTIENLQLLIFDNFLRNFPEKIVLENTHSSHISRDLLIDHLHDFLVIASKASWLDTTLTKLLPVVIDDETKRRQTLEQNMNSQHDLQQMLKTAKHESSNKNFISAYQAIIERWFMNKADPAHLKLLLDHYQLIDAKSFFDFYSALLEKNNCHQELVDFCKEHIDKKSVCKSNAEIKLAELIFNEAIIYEEAPFNEFNLNPHQKRIAQLLLAYSFIENNTDQHSQLLKNKIIQTLACKDLKLAIKKELRNEVSFQDCDFHIRQLYFNYILFKQNAHNPKMQQEIIALCKELAQRQHLEYCKEFSNQTDLSTSPIAMSIFAQTNNKRTFAQSDSLDKEKTEPAHKEQKLN